MWLGDLNYNLGCDWLFELFHKNLAGELVEDSSLLKQSRTVEEIVIFVISDVITFFQMQFRVLTYTT